LEGTVALNGYRGPTLSKQGYTGLPVIGTGLNLQNPRDKLVGSRVDWEAIVAEIKKVCVSQPSTLLVTAAGDTYWRFQQNGK
jgi:hypothetical protein